MSRLKLLHCVRIDIVMYSKTPGNCCVSTFMCKPASPFNGFGKTRLMRVCTSNVSMIATETESAIANSTSLTAIEPLGSAAVRTPTATRSSDRPEPDAYRQVATLSPLLTLS